MMIKSRKRERDDGADEVETIKSKDFLPKKLRLIFRERTAAAVLEDACKAPTQNSAIDFIQEFLDSFLEHLKPSECQSVCERLIQLMKERGEREVRQRAALCLRRVLASFVSSLSAQELHTEVDNILQLGNTRQDMSCVLRVWRCLLENRIIRPGASNFSQLQTLILECLKTESWSCRALALSLVTISSTQFCAIDSEQDTEAKRSMKSKLEETLCRYIDDSDPRVRSAAADCLLAVAEGDNSVSLSVECYARICQLLSDQCDTVRVTALKILKWFARMYPDERVLGRKKGMELRLVDDAFSKLCDAVHDAEIPVRAEAIQLLGTVENVSDSFLEQTLDKKLLSHMKFTKTSRFSRDRAIQEWSTGRRFGEDIPAEKAEEDSESLIPGGACGAFVSGLEDEFMSVRLAAVRSLGALAERRAGFARKAVDFLADMFNDEIESIRLEAIHCIRPLLQYAPLTEEQMETILNVLDDAAGESRAALRELISCCRMETVTCVKMTVDALLNNLLRYPADKTSIWDCMKCLGRTHASMVLPLVGDLLGLHPFFDTPEPPIENPAYMSKLVLVLNAASKCPPCQALFPDHTKRHYRFLRDSSPHMVAPIQCLSRSGEEEEEGSAETAERMILEILERTRVADTLHSDTRREITEFVIDDLESVCEMSEELRPCGSFLRSACQFRVLLESSTNKGQGTPNPRDWRKLCDLLEEMSTGYFGVDDETTAWIGECRLRLVAARLQSGDSSLLLKVFIRALDHCKKLAGEGKGSGSHSDFLTSLSAVGDSAVDSDLSGQPISSQLRERLGECLRSSGLVLPGMGNLRHLRRRQSWILDPSKETETTIRFVAGLVTSVELTACLRNFPVSELKNVRIRVLYPDMKEVLMAPRKTDFRIVSPDLTRLRTDVLLTSFSWTEKAPVLLELVQVRKEEEIEFRRCVAGEEKSERWIALRADAGDSFVEIGLFPKMKC